jgi:hypothetical protein
MSKHNIWTSAPAWLRALAIDAKIYRDQDTTKLVQQALRGDKVSLEICRLHHTILARS